MLRGAYSTTGIRRGGETTLIQVPPAGQYVFGYSLTSGAGDWKAAKSYRTGLDLSNPLLPVTSADELLSKPLPFTHSFCWLAADDLVLN
jgi:hypothetical protein